MKRLMIALCAVFAMSVAAAAQDVDLDTKYATEMLKKGEKVPALVMNDLSGISRSLKEFKGRYVVLDFWATWCPDCRADVPAMKEAYRKYASDKVAFVSVSFDTEGEKLRNYVEENGIGWLQLCDYRKKKESPVAEAFHVKWIPSMYLIDPKGKVVLGTVMVEKLTAELEKIR